MKSFVSKTCKKQITQFNCLEIQSNLREHNKTNKITCGPSYHKAQTGNLHILISVFAKQSSQAFFQQIAKTDKNVQTDRLIRVFIECTAGFADFILQRLISKDGI